MSFEDYEHRDRAERKAGAQMAARVLGRQVPEHTEVRLASRQPERETDEQFRRRVNAEMDRVLAESTRKTGEAAQRQAGVEKGRKHVSSVFLPKRYTAGQIVR